MVNKRMDLVDWVWDGVIGRHLERGKDLEGSYSILYLRGGGGFFCEILIG